MTSSESLLTPVDRVLEEQRSLTAVDRFTRRHGHDAPPAQQRYYRDLIPLAAPGPGQQFAFEVDLDKCSGCQACVTACHSLNGLDDDESWRKVGLLFSDDWRRPYQASVTTACHHCVDPGCLTGCPVLAYDKDPVTGIVRHLDDQCIGCKYCVMKCPYEVPKFSSKRGIVRKCDMCSSRLSHGEAPACVQACPTQAIRITLVEQARVAKSYRGSPGAVFLPASPDPRHTVPTTRYVSSKPIPRNLAAGDHARVAPAEAHLPLVFMLVLSQLSVGAATASAVHVPGDWQGLIPMASCALALGLGTLHLGRPAKAWRAFLAWRTSWFSREVIAFAAYFLLAAAAAAASRLPAGVGSPKVLALTAAAAGSLGVACSAMVYADTRREFWSPLECLVRFFGSTVLLGSSLEVVLASSALPASPVLFMGSAAATAAAASVKLVFELRIFKHLADDDTRSLGPLARTARLLENELGSLNRLRLCLGLLGGVVIPALLVLAVHTGVARVTPPALAAFALCLAGETIERHLFFVAVAPARMPGALAS